ncbi:MAG: hypothetical protein OHK0015_36100 [Chloroflexi bacterium OHK40]
MHSAKKRGGWLGQAQGVCWLRGWLGLLLGLLLTIAGASAAGSDSKGEALACPSGQTTWLHGYTRPGSGLLVYFNGAPVGGGSSGPDGVWTIPLMVRERAGVYSVAVTNRQDSSLVAAFTCYVDVPLGATPTGTPTLGPPASTSPPLPASTATAGAATALNAPAASPTATAASTSPSPSATVLTGVDSPTATQPATAELPAATPTPASPTLPTPTPSSSAESAVVLVTVQADDPDDPELFEYALLENTSAAPQSLVGWRLVHTGSGEGYAFPQVTIPAGEQFVIWSGDGEDDPATGTLYWPPASRWAAGDTAELRDANSHVVSSLVVSPPEIEE